MINFLLHFHFNRTGGLFIFWLFVAFYSWSNFLKPNMWSNTLHFATCILPVLFKIYTRFSDSNLGRCLDIWEIGTVQEARLGAICSTHDVPVWRHWGEAASTPRSKVVSRPPWVFWYTWYELFHCRDNFMMQLRFFLESFMGASYVSFLTAGCTSTKIWSFKVQLITNRC